MRGAAAVWARRAALTLHEAYSHCAVEMLVGMVLPLRRLVWRVQGGHTVGSTRLEDQGAAW